LVVGVVITFVAMHRAPEAFEDEDGFHYVNPSEARIPEGVREHADEVPASGAKLA
jgi:hypothetical protein